MDTEEKSLSGSASLQVAVAIKESSLSEEIPLAINDTAKCKNDTARNSCVDKEEGGNIVGVDSNKENVKGKVHWDKWKLKIEQQRVIFGTDNCRGQYRSIYLN